MPRVRRLVWSLQEPACLRNVYSSTIDVSDLTPSPASRLLQIELSHTIEDAGPRQPSRGGSNKPTLATRWRIGRTHACRAMENWTNPRLPHDGELDQSTPAARWRIGRIHACLRRSNCRSAPAREGISSVMDIQLTHRIRGQAPPTTECAIHSARRTRPVGAGLLAKASSQKHPWWMNKTFRQQAGSFRSQASRRHLATQAVTLER